MSKRFVPAASVLAAVMAFQAHHAAGADDCVVEPTHQPPDGQHWYYRFDQAKNRKCWHLGEAGLTVQRPPPDLPRPPGPVADRPGRRDEAALSRARRDELFQDFMRWNELQRNFQ
jgi:hypothetical protein